MAPGTARGVRLRWLAAGSLGLALAVGALAVALGPGALSSHAGRSPLAATAAALALVAASVAAAAGPAGPRVALLALAVSVCWTAPVWVGWSDGPPLARGLGAVAAPFLVPVVALWVVDATRGRLRYAGRALVAVALLQAVVSTVGHALLDDPLNDPGCWANCIVNVFLVRSEPGLVADLDRVGGAVLIAVGAALAVVSLAAWWSATGPARRSQWPLLAGSVVTGAAVIAHEILVSDRPEKPVETAYHSVYLVLAGGMILLAGGPILAWLRSTAQRWRVSRMAADLAERSLPGSLESALARAVGDPALTIAYWMPSAERFVDGRGHEIDAPVADADDRVTTLARDGQALALVRHASSVTDAVRGLGAGTQLALDNERLQASLLSQAEDVRASRERIVETADAGRQRLERDLHDGAQQRLLALSYRLRLARTAAEADEDHEAADLLARAVDESMLALDELRALAHGIYPAILAEAGLGPALVGLSDTSDIPVSVVVAADERAGVPVETAAYVVVREALADSESRAATTVDVRVDRQKDRFVILVEDDGAPRSSDLQAVADRVGALGGTLHLGPRVLRAELPCA